MLLCWCAFYLIYHVSPELHSRPSFLAPPLPFLPSLYLPPASPPPRSSTHLIPEKLSIKWDALACDYFSVLGIWYKKAKAPALLLQHFLIIVLIENLYRPLSLSHSHTHTHTHTFPSISVQVGDRTITFRLIMNGGKSRGKMSLLHRQRWVLGAKLFYGPFRMI